jgi:type III secretory pathway component EscR
MDKLVLPRQHSDVINISVSMEPIVFAVGFREIDNFKDIATVFQEIDQKMTYVPPEINNYEEFLKREKKEKARAVYEKQKQTENNQLNRVSLKNIKHKQLI